MEIELAEVSSKDLKQPLLRLFLFLLSALHLTQSFGAIPPSPDPHCSGRPNRGAAECRGITQDAQGNLQADRMTANGVVQGTDRQQVSVSGAS